ncbi:DNA methyltransferase [Vibrio sp. SCSIO 43137]|uniref:DNA methyltransferase n=1 Tax=Vibrio sp. SCSIO 43137 TaxID=3021011 RepID=UPI002307A5C5|nr:DNA methyltransferase [Vibrio sp. SCSIO 43137]WCE30065.1 DNA methyltransferase [Vibrio sp. SCSIO 43137]
MQDILKVGRSDSIYNGHSYLTKVPVMAIVPFIEEYTQPGDMVVDIFAGSGMTAVAAKMTGRNAVVSDISRLGKHIGTGYLSDVSPHEFEAEALRILNESKAAVGHYYNTIRGEDDSKITFGKTIWSFVYECGHCKNEINYYNALRDCNWDSKKLKCPSCDETFVKKGAKFLRDEPVVVSMKGTAGKQIEQPLSKFDYEKIAKAEQSDIFEYFPSVEIPEDREMYKRSALKKWNLTSTHKFFSHRNAIVLHDLWQRFELINDAQLKQKLKFAFTAILPRASKRYQWSKKAPLNAAIQNYYIAPVFYEWNVYELIERKINALIKADRQITDYQRSNSPEVQQEYVTASADNLTHLRDNSVDLVFTDPPFGSNIFYADMNLFHEAWLGEYTDNTSEAVMRTTGKEKAKSKEHYQSILTGAFKEARRVLKNKGHLSVVFGNSQGSIWAVVQQALRDAGFTDKPVDITILDKGQRSVKGLNSGTEKVVTLDLIVTVQKCDDSLPIDYELRNESIEIIKKTMQNISFNEELTASHIYLDILRTAMYEGVTIAEIDLSDITQIIHEKGYSIDPDTGKLTKE